MFFTSFRICITFTAFKITFLKLKENQQLVNTSDFTLNYLLKQQRLLVMKQNFDFSCLKYLPYEVNSWQVLKFFMAFD